MRLSTGDEEGMVVEKIDREPRKLIGENTRLFRFLNNNRICAEGVSLKESDKEVTLLVSKKIDGEFRTVIYLRYIFDILYFYFLIGNRKIKIHADEADCIICVGILYGHGSNWLSLYRRLIYPGFFETFEVENSTKNTKVENAFVERYWVE